MKGSQLDNVAQSHRSGSRDTRVESDLFKVFNFAGHFKTGHLVYVLVWLEIDSLVDAANLVATNIMARK